MTDSISHNKDVLELNAENIGTNLEGQIMRDKIFANFLVNTTVRFTSVTEQALNCITRLINHDFDHKPWNKANEFDIHIAPMKNLSLNLKDQWFNRLIFTCAIALYHYVYDDVVSFLEKYQHVTDQLAYIVHCFLEVGSLKILFCAGALIGLHLIHKSSSNIQKTVQGSHNMPG